MEGNLVQYIIICDGSVEMRLQQFFSKYCLYHLTTWLTPLEQLFYLEMIETRSGNGTIKCEVLLQTIIPLESLPGKIMEVS